MPPEHVAGLGDAGVAEHPLQRALAEGADVADDDRDRRQDRQRRRPLVDLGAEGDVEEAQEDGEGGGLGGDRHEGRDRGRRPLVDVRRPLVEGGDRGLEGEADGGHRDPDQDQRVAQHPLVGDPDRDPGEVGRAGAAVEEGHPVEQRRRADRADDQVLEPGLERALAPQVGRAEDVERDREGLDRDEEGDQVARLGEQDHAQHRADQQRVVLARAGFLGRRLADREQDGEGRHPDRDQRERDRQVVEHQGAGDQFQRLVPVPDQQPGGGRQGDQGEERRGAPQRPDHRAHQDDDEADREGDDRGDPGVIDMRLVEVHLAAFGP